MVLVVKCCVCIRRAVLNFSIMVRESGSLCGGCSAMDLDQLVCRREVLDACMCVREVRPRFRS